MDSQGRGEAGYAFAVLGTLSCVSVLFEFCAVTLTDRERSRLPPECKAYCINSIHEEKQLSRFEKFAFWAASFQAQFGCAALPAHRSS